MKTLLAIISLTLLSSCTYPRDYQWVYRDLIIEWKTYKLTNIEVCTNNASNCRLWIVYPSNWTGVVSLQSWIESKHDTTSQTIIIP